MATLMRDSNYDISARNVNYHKLISSKQYSLSYRTVWHSVSAKHLVESLIMTIKAYIDRSPDNISP